MPTPPPTHKSQTFPVGPKAQIKQDVGKPFQPESPTVSPRSLLRSQILDQLCLPRNFRRKRGTRFAVHGYEQRGEKQKEVTLDPVLRKVKLTFAERAWQLQGFRLRMEGWTAGLEAMGTSPGSLTRVPQPLRGEVDNTAGPARGTGRFLSRSSLVRTWFRQHTPSKREKGREGRPRGLGAGEAGHAPCTCRGGSAQSSPKEEWEMTPLSITFKVLIITPDRAY